LMNEEVNLIRRKIKDGEDGMWDVMNKEGMWLKGRIEYKEN
jgi:hypothetical protein